MRFEPRVNILLVDDNASNLVALEAILKGLDQHLVRARSGGEALHRLLDDDFAVILMDVQMPGMDGFEAAELIRGRDRSRYTPIIFLTAYERSDVQLFKGYSLGAVDFLFKPIVPEALRSKVAVFADLFRKTEEVRRQAELLRENQEREHARALLEEKQRWEMERLRQEAAKERRIAEEFAEADRRKDEFLAMLSHELRNPLAAILNALHVLRSPNIDAEAAEQTRDVAERQTRNLVRLVDDLLDVARISSGKIQLRLEPVDLAAAVARAVEAVRSFIDSRSHALSVMLPPEELIVRADEARLEQILTNLLNNAAKYTEPGGRIGLSVQARETEVLLHVRDNGSGINPELMPHIFDLFTQESRSLDRCQGGLGIGLTLVKSLVEMHGGSISVSSPGPGQGSEFVVSLPLDRSARAGPPRESAPGDTSAETVAAQPKTVLVVDDNVDGSQMLARLLRTWGHDVTLVHDGPGAIDLVGALQPDVVILDIGLPGMDGYQVARQLQRRQGDRRPLLVALTGYGQAEHVRRSQEVGIDHHFLKPVDLDKLRELIDRPMALAQHRSGRAS